MDTCKGICRHSLKKIKKNLEPLVEVFKCQPGKSGPDLEKVACSKGSWCAARYVKNNPVHNNWMALYHVTDHYHVTEKWEAIRQVHVKPRNVPTDAIIYWGGLRVWSRQNVQTNVCQSWSVRRTTNLTKKKIVGIQKEICGSNWDHSFHMGN